MMVIQKVGHEFRVNLVAAIYQELQTQMQTEQANAPGVPACLPPYGENRVIREQRASFGVPSGSQQTILNQ
jgi:hypothetical protein